MISKVVYTTIFNCNAIFEIVSEISYLEYDYLEPSWKCADIEYRRLWANGMIKGPGDHYIYVMGDTEHVPTIQTGILSLRLGDIT